MKRWRLRVTAITYVEGPPDGRMLASYVRLNRHRVRHTNCESADVLVDRDGAGQVVGFEVIFPLQVGDKP